MLLPTAKAYRRNGEQVLDDGGSVAMRRCYSCLALLILSPALLFFAYWAYDRHEFAYRLALEVDTPFGLRRGESIVRISFSPSFGWPSRGIDWRGEATVVDLGEGKHVIALLAAGPRGDGGNLHMLVSQAFFGLSPQGHLLRAPIEVAELPVGTRVVLAAETIPTMVTFSDLADPSSAMLLAPQRFWAVFGPGYALRSASLEIVAPGIWPINYLPIAWPQWLFGAPSVRKIETTVPVILSKLRQLDTSLQVSAPNDPLKVRSGHLLAR